MEKIYLVTFESHVNCTIYNMVFYCMAHNAKEACAIAAWFWHEHKGAKPYMFHLSAKKSPVQEPSMLAVKNYLGREFTGEKVMETFHCVESRTWRVNGRNLYGC